MEIEGFNLRLTAALKVAKLSNAALARDLSSKYEIETSRAAVGDWTKGRNYPQLKTFYAICKILDESADHLLFGHISKAIDRRVVAAKEALVGLSPQQKQDLLRLLLPELSANN